MIQMLRDVLLWNDNVDNHETAQVGLLKMSKDNDKLVLLPCRSLKKVL